MAKRTISGEVFSRTLVLDREQANDEQRTMPAALSSELPVARWFGTEVLSHDQDSIDLSRAAGGLPMLFNHNSDQPIGVIRDIKLDADRKLRGTLHFSNNAKATEVWGDVRDGFLKDISIGYQIRKWKEEADSDTVRVTDWLIHEASVVTVPADHTVGINRNMEGIMPTENKSGGDIDARDELNVVDLKATRERNLKEGQDAGAKAERKRQADIRSSFVAYLSRGGEYQDLLDHCVDKGVTAVRANELLLSLLAGDAQPLAGDYHQTETNGSMDRNTAKDVKFQSGSYNRGGADVLDRFMEGAEKAIMVRANLIEDRDEQKAARSNEFYGMRMSEIAREYLRAINVDTKGMDQRGMVGAAFTRAAISHSTSDFSNLLENIANKAALIGFEEAPETWATWARKGSLSDFRQASRVNMSTFGDLDVIYENGEYKYGTFSDLKETLTLATYGKMFNISRQAIINDDLDAFSRIPRSMGRAASRKVGDLAYEVLTSNPTMNQDATALFHANHNNFVAGGSGAAPSVATIEAARTAMALQTDPAGNVLNISPAYLLVPKALEGTAKVIASAEYDPAGTAGTLTPNTVSGTFTVVSDARLDADDPAAWYMLANQSMHDTVEVAFLDGNDAPYLESKDGWSQDGVEYKVRIDAVAAPLDFRAAYFNDGN